MTQNTNTQAKHTTQGKYTTQIKFTRKHKANKYYKCFNYTPHTVSSRSACGMEKVRKPFISSTTHIRQTHTHTLTRTHTHTHTQGHTHAHTYTHTHTHTHARAHTRTHTHTHLYTHASPSLSFLSLSSLSLSTSLRSLMHPMLSYSCMWLNYLTACAFYSHIFTAHKHNSEIVIFNFKIVAHNFLTH
jgi:hypothetical protein